MNTSTPKGWRVAPVGIEQEGYREILDANGYRLATLGKGNGQWLSRNARLMAHSPQLLEAVKLAAQLHPEIDAFARVIQRIEEGKP